MDAKATTFPLDKNLRLADLGLTESLLLRAIGHGLLAWANCSDNDPPVYVGSTFWAMTVRALRDELGATRWRKDDDGLSLVVNESEDTAILVVAGNGGTGDPEKFVSTKRARGTKTTEQVQLNNVQLPLFPLDVPNVESGFRHVWMLLYHRDLIRQEVRSELSLPIGMGENARPDKWRERIVLDAIPFDNDVVYPDADDPLGPDIDVPVEKRA